jgi:hypothetical protein
MGAAQAALGWVALAEGRSDDAFNGFRTSLRLIYATGHLVSAPSLLFGLAGTAAAEGDVMRSARLAAAASYAEEVFGRQPSGADSGIHLRYLDRVHAVTDPSIWDTETLVGEHMGLDEAVSYALGERGPGTTASDRRDLSE